MTPIKPLALTSICLIISGVVSTHSALAKPSKPFFPLSEECQKHCERQGEKVDFVESKVESQCDCYPE
jgi:hypothetical protein